MLAPGRRSRLPPPALAVPCPLVDLVQQRSAPFDVLSVHGRGLGWSRAQTMPSQVTRAKKGNTPTTANDWPSQTGRGYWSDFSPRGDIGGNAPKQVQAVEYVFQRASTFRLDHTLQRDPRWDEVGLEGIPKAYS